MVPPQSMNSIFLIALLLSAHLITTNSSHGAADITETEDCLIACVILAVVCNFGCLNEIYQPACVMACGDRNLQCTNSCLAPGPNGKAIAATKDSTVMLIN